jgi:two-component sensor histidine kinase
MVERSRKEKDLRLALADRELLLMEIEHRVKNNLSVVTSVLRLGRSDVEDDRASKILLEAETRIRSMALMYERLYDSKSLADVELGVYVRKLGAQLMKAYAVSSNIALDVVSDEIHMDMKRVVPLGLILNELITNALKYAFPGGQGGIRIELRRSESRISVRVSDNGVGFPADFRAERTGGVGYKLVLMLTAQLKGEIATGKREGGAGASTTLAFPL